MLGFWIIVGLALVLGVLALRGDRAQRAYVRGRLAEPRLTHAPKAAVIVPVKGADEGLRENLAALAGLDYPDFELIVVARDGGDIPSGVVPERARVVVAGEGDPGTGEKINNLLAAVSAASPETEILAFADSDGQVSAGWLAALVRGLDQTNAGASTGYRYYLPREPDFWSQARGVWNAVIAGGFGPGDSRFAWGGAMAIRRQTFEQARVGEFWRNSVSDDYALTRAVKSAGLRVVYEPGALVVSSDQTGAGELLGWIKRQMIITRVYAPGLWRLGLFGHVVYCGAMAASAGLALQGNLTGVYTLLAQLIFGMARGAQRLRLMRESLPGRMEWFERHGHVHVWWSPLGTWLWMYGLVVSAVTRTINWRGNRYRIRAGRVERM